MGEHHISWPLYAIATFVVGMLAGYWVGVVHGRQEGRVAFRAEQETVAEAERLRAQEQLTEVANPFAAENPLEGGYQNPFKENINPFSQ